MDDLRSTLTNISLYDVKAYVRKAQNVVMNLTPMEAQVREATNNEPWGASSTLMQQIADGSRSYSQFHEIMPMIYKRFTEKSADEWRQIYKALQLLEFLVKNGDERVVDYARSHSAVIEMLKHFHYTDANGRDQGINIRNRAKELLALLSDDSRIREERKKARKNRSKYGGVTGGAVGGPSGGFGGSGKKYGGFGSDDAGFGAGASYDGPAYNHHTNHDTYGNFGGDRSNSAGGSAGDDDDDFEEYQVPSSSKAKAKAESAEPVVPASQAADIISFDDDEFDDFQSAVPQSAGSGAGSLADVFASPAPQTQSSSADILAKFQTSPSTQFQQPQSQQPQFQQPQSQQPQFQQPQFQQPQFQTATPNFSSTSTPLTGAFSGSNSGPSGSISSPSSGQSQKPKPADDAFSALWTSSKTKQEPKTSLSSLAQQSVQDSMWNQAKPPASQSDDLLSF